MPKIEVDKALIKKVATSARLSLSEEELEKFVPQIKEIILDSFSKLDELDAKEEPSFQPIKMSNRFRADEVKPCLTLDEALKNVLPSLRENGYIKGPKPM
ncbi:MAG: Asp-tRNA(Asn)/Glu-tRNA(Gln) amidotransferase subunit GatC [archaeon]